MTRRGATGSQVVYDSFLEDGQPAPPAPAVVAWLLRQGVHTLVCGHQPHGDAPVLLPAVLPAVLNASGFVPNAPEFLQAGLNVLYHCASERAWDRVRNRHSCLTVDLVRVVFFG